MKLSELSQEQKEQLIELMFDDVDNDWDEVKVITDRYQILIKDQYYELSSPILYKGDLIEVYYENVDAEDNGWDKYIAINLSDIEISEELINEILNLNKENVEI